MTLSKNLKIALSIIIWSFLLYFVFFRFEIEKTPFICAICRGEIVTTNFYLSGCQIIRSESAINNIDEIYQKYINEKHSHLLVKNGRSERSDIWGNKSYVQIPSLLEPSFSSVYSYGSALKKIKENLKNGNSKDILKAYHETIEQLKLNNIGLETKLRAENKDISDLLKDKN